MTSQVFRASVIVCAALLAVLPGAQALGQFDLEPKITASDAAGIVHFGNAVGISGDTAIVGANWNFVPDSDSGSACIFDRVVMERLLAL